VAESITVLIPAYNEASRIGAAIESVLGQTHRPSEILVIDDGSTDQTAAIAAGYPGVRVISQENAGISSARNHGFRAATGDWIALLDADDLWLPDRLEWLIRATQMYPYVHFGFSDFTVQEDGRQSRPNLLRTPQYREAKGAQNPSGISRMTKSSMCRAIAFGNFIGTSTVFVRRSFIYENYLWFDESLPLRKLDYQLSEDAEWYLRVFNHTDAVVIERVLARYVARPGSQASSLGRVRYGDFKLGERVIVNQTLYGPGSGSAFESLRRIHLQRSAIDHMRHAEFGLARSRFTDAQKERFVMRDAVLLVLAVLLDNPVGRQAGRLSRSTWRRWIRPRFWSLRRVGFQ
jgi:glycosyltransferase involved in cell wall biosynthesis